MYLDDIAFVFKLRNGAGCKLCLLIEGKSPLAKNTLCKVVSWDILMLDEIANLRTPPTHWQIPIIGLVYRLNVVPLQSNPFDRRRNESIELQVAQYVFKKSNATMYACKKRDPICAKSVYYWPLVLRKTKLDRTDIDYTTRITTGISGYKFLTCYTQSNFSLEFYTKPFQPEMWVGLFLCVGLVILVMTVWMHFKIMKEQISATFSPWIYLVSSIFEESVPVPNKIEKAYFFRIILGSWSLVTVVLTNCYNGIMMEDFVSPVRQYAPEKFTDLVCGAEYEGWMRALNSYKVGTMKDSEWKKIGNAIRKDRLGGWDKIKNSDQIRNDVSKISGDCFRLLSRIEVDSHQPEYEFLSFIREIVLDRNNNYENIWSDKVSSDLQEILVLLHLENPKFAYVPESLSISENLTFLDSLVETEVVNCGKTVLISKSNMVQAEYEYLRRKYPNKNFYKGNQILEANQEGWVFRRAGSLKVPLYYKFLVEAGVFLRLQEEITARKVKYRISAVKAKEKILEKGMNMSEGVTSLFYICAAIISLSIICLVGECRLIILANASRIVRKIKQICKDKEERELLKRIKILMSK